MQGRRRGGEGERAEQRAGPASRPTGWSSRSRPCRARPLTLSRPRGRSSRSRSTDLADGSPSLATSTAGSRPSASSRARRWSTGPYQEDFPAAAADGKGGAWVVYVEHEPARPEILRPLTERPKDFAAYRPQGGRRPGPPAPVRHGKAGEPHRRDRQRAATSGGPPSPSTATASVVVAWTENARRQLGPLRRPLRSPTGSRWSERKRLTDRPGTDADVVLATAPDGTVWMAWQAWDDGQADILLAPVDDAGKPVRAVSERTPANEWSPAHRRRQGGARPRRLRQLRGGQLRRRAPHARARRQRSAPRSRSPARRVRGAAEPGDRPEGPRLGRLRGADRRTGARTPRT